MIIKHNIPKELTKINQWVYWKYIEKDGKETKIPVNIDGRPASTIDPKHYSSFNDLAPNLDYFSGVGFVFTESDPYCGIDIDDCIDSEGNLHAIAREIVDHFNSYTEISPSGTGLKIFVKGRKSTNRCKVSIRNSPVSLELYDAKRFFTVTSDVYEDSPITIRDCQAELKEFEDKYFPTSTKGGATTARAKELSEPEIDEIIAKIRKSTDGTTFTELYDQGNMGNYDDDHSKADFALLCIISKYCDRNRIAMEDIFSSSALGQRGKWINRKDYRERTITRVLMDTSEHKEDLYSTLLKDHYILGKKIIRIDLLADGGYFLTETSAEIVNVKVGATNRKQKDQWWRWLVENKEIKILDCVESISDPDTTEPYYIFVAESGILRIHVPPIKTIIEDNAFIEEYLETTFGEYKTFFKEYMAAYAFTNFRQLPSLIFYGSRGKAKSTAAQMVADMFFRLYDDWSGGESNYTPEVEKKLAVVEENSTISKQQYKTLKKYTGQPYLTVNKKYQPIYKVRNNLSVIVISNDNIPLYVEKDEMPTSPKNNQFFVWKFTKKIDSPDPDFREKIKRRLGHYIQTELRKVFENLDLSASRYSIEVPITPYERQLFNNSVTNIELISEELLSSMIRGLADHHRNRPLDPYHSFTQEEMGIYFNQLLQKRLPIPLLRHYLQNESNFSECTQYLLKRGYIKDGGSSRKTIDGVQFRYYDILSWDSLDELIHRMKEMTDENDRLFTASGVVSGKEDN